MNSTQAVGLSQNITDFVKLSENGEEFSLSVHEFGNENNKFFDTADQHFVFSEYYIQLQAELETSGRIFGLGERTREFWLEEGTYTMWARDEPDPYDDGHPPGKNTYGVHPVVFAQNNRNSDFFALLNLNANAQDAIIGPKKGTGNGKNLQFITMRSPRPLRACRKGTTLACDRIPRPRWQAASTPTLGPRLASESLRLRQFSHSRRCRRKLLECFHSSGCDLV